MSLSLLLIMCYPAFYGLLITSRSHRLITVGYYAVITVCAFLTYVSAVQDTTTILQISNSNQLVTDIAGLRIDTLSGLICFSVLCIGLWCMQYSQVYLADEKHCKVTIRYIGSLLSCVILMLLSDNLILFLASSFVCSGLVNKLLLYYPNRTSAKLGAKQYFWSNRFSELCLLFALILIILQGHSVNFELINHTQITNSVDITIAVLIVLAAMARSVCMPLHFWLPNTMDTPLPISALLHAGIINTGGYLLIRCSWYLSQVHHLLFILAVIAAVSACVAILIMNTQTDIKNQLAYSTVAQMSFMIMQCGLGTFVLAAMHIISHAFYKAYAFLNANTSMEIKSTQYSTTQISLKYSMAIISLLIGLNYLFFKFLPNQEAILIMVFSCSVVQLLLFSPFKNISLIISLCVLYVGLYLAGKYLFHGLLPQPIKVLSTLDYFLIAMVLSTFLTTHLIIMNLKNITMTELGRKLYVKLYNGFYLTNNI